MQRMGGLLALLAALILSQDRGWVDKLKTLTKDPTPRKAADLRAELAEEKSGDIKHVVTALRGILRDVEAGPPNQTKGSLDALSKYLDKVGSKLSNHKRGLDAAMGAGSAGRMLAMAHLEHLLEAGAKPRDLSKTIKKLKLKSAGGRLYVPSTALGIVEVKRIVETGNPASLLKMRTKGLEVSYLKAYGLLKGMENDPRMAEEAQRALSSARKLSAEHIRTLLEVLKPFGRCKSCSGSRKVKCRACGAKGEVKIICPHCDGKGIVKLEKLNGADTIRNRTPGQGATVQTGKGTTVSVGADETICPTCIYDAREQTKKCDFCQGSRSVECQRCKWNKPKLAWLVDTKPCKNCAGSGFAFQTIRAPCPFCKGLGLFLIPKADSSKAIGPFE